MPGDKEKGRKRASEAPSSPVNAKKKQMAENEVSELVVQAQSFALGNPPNSKGISKKDWRPYADLFSLMAQMLEKFNNFPPLTTPPPPPPPPPTWVPPAAPRMAPPVPPPRASRPPPSKRSPPSGVGASFSGSVSWEEHQRLRSIVVAGLPEPSSALSSVDQAKADRAAVEGLLSLMEVAAVPNEVYRMGKLGGAHPRLVKVVLPSRQFVYQALRNATKLKEAGNHRSVFIRKSMTREQREELAAKREQLRELRQIEGDACRWVLYRDELWLRDEIPSRKRTTIPQLGLPSGSENVMA